MGAVPPSTGFNAGLREITARHGALLIMDEVMTGFRVSPAGWYGLDPVDADLFTFGKVMSGGLAGGGVRRTSRGHGLPGAGRTGVPGRHAVWESGRGGGRPGHAAQLHPGRLRAIGRHRAVVGRLVDDALSAAGVVHQVQYAGNLFSVFFAESPVTNFAQARRPRHSGTTRSSTPCWTPAFTCRPARSRRGSSRGTRRRGDRAHRHRAPGGGQSSGRGAGRNMTEVQPLRVVHLLRHGEVFNPDRVLYGRLDGFPAVRHWATSRPGRPPEYLAKRDIGYLVSSPLERAMQTARPVGERFGLPIHLDDRLIEAENKLQGRQVSGGKALLADPRNWRLPGQSAPTVLGRAVRRDRAAGAGRRPSRPRPRRGTPPRPCASATSCRSSRLVATPRAAASRARSPAPAVRAGLGDLADLRTVTSWCESTTPSRPVRRRPDPSPERDAGGWGRRRTRAMAPRFVAHTGRAMSTSTQPRRCRARDRVVVALAGLITAGLTLAACATGKDAVDQQAGGQYPVRGRDRQGPDDRGGRPQDRRHRDRHPCSTAGISGWPTTRARSSWSTSGRPGATPCQTESPQFDLLYRAVKAQGVQFVGIDAKDNSRSAVAHSSRPTTSASRSSGTSRRGPRSQLGKVPSASLPFTVVVDKQQRIAAVYFGAVLPADLRPVITELARET